MAVSASKKQIALISGGVAIISGENYDVQGDLASNETVVVQKGIGMATIAGVDKIRLPGRFTDYCITARGAKDTIYSKLYEISITDTPNTKNGTILYFDDGSTATLAPNRSIHYDSVFLQRGATYYTQDSNMTIQAGSNNTIKLAPDKQNVTIKGLDGTLVLAGTPIEKVSLLSSGNTVQIKQGEIVIATIDDSSLKQATIKLLFENGSGSLALGQNGPQFHLDGLQMRSIKPYTLPNSGVSVVGSKDNTVVIAPGDINEDIIGAGRIVFAGKESDYTFGIRKASVPHVDVHDSFGNTVASISGIVNGTISFADGGSHTLTRTSDGYKIDGAALQTTFAPIAASSDYWTQNLKFTITDDGGLGDYAGAIKNDLSKAISDIAKYLNAQGSFDILLTGKALGSSILAQSQGGTCSTPSSLVSLEHGATQSTIFQVESCSGYDANGASPDATVVINTNLLSRMNLDQTKAPTSSEYDLTTVLEHELLHAMGFTGYLGTSSGGAFYTSFDKEVQFINGNPFFVGKNAEAVYGGPVPLAPASAGAGSAYYHVNVSGDLMSASLAPGQVKTVSALDAAILKDIGIPETTLVGVSTDAQNILLHAQA